MNLLLFHLQVNDLILVFKIFWMRLFNEFTYLFVKLINFSLLFCQLLIPSLIRLHFNKPRIFFNTLRTNLFHWKRSHLRLHLGTSWRKLWNSVLWFYAQSLILILQIFYLNLKVLYRFWRIGDIVFNAF